MSIASDMIRGHTDTIILAHLLSGEMKTGYVKSIGDSYGYKINRSIAEKTGGQYELKEATLYTAFRRLEQMGLITSYWGDENTGARRRYYSITQAGVQEYHRMLGEWEQSQRLIETLITP